MGIIESIHPFSASYQGPGHWGNSPRTSLFIATFSNLSDKRPAFSTVSWVCYSVSSQSDITETPYLGNARTMFDVEKQNTQNDQGLHPFSKAELRHPNFCYPYLWSQSFGHYPQLAALDEDGNNDRIVNWQLHFLKSTLWICNWVLVLESTENE